MLVVLFQIYAPSKHGGSAPQDDGFGSRSEAAPAAIPAHYHDACGRRPLGLRPRDGLAIRPPEGGDIWSTPPTDDCGDQDGQPHDRPSPQDAPTRLPLHVPAAGYLAGRLPAPAVWAALLRGDGPLRVCACSSTGVPIGSLG